MKAGVTAADAVFGKRWFMGFVSSNGINSTALARLKVDNRIPPERSARKYVSFISVIPYSSSYIVTLVHAFLGRILIAMLTKIRYAVVLERSRRTRGRSHTKPGLIGKGCRGGTYISVSQLEWP